MNHRTDDKLSALVDNELGEWEFRSVVQSLGHDRRMQACWRNYHLIGDAIRGSLPEHVCPDLTDRISNALEAEPHHFNPQTTPAQAVPVPQPRTRGVLGFALAASISAVAVVGVMGIDRDAGMSQEPAIAAAGGEVALPAESRAVLSSLLNELAATPPANVQQPVAGIRTVSGVDSRSVAPDLYEYLMNYHEYSTRGQDDDPLSYLRVVSQGTAP